MIVIYKFHKVSLSVVPTSQEPGRHALPAVPFCTSLKEEVQGRGSRKLGHTMEGHLGTPVEEPVVSWFLGAASIQSWDRTAGILILFPQEKKKKKHKSKGNPPPVTKGDFKESSLPFPGLCVLHWALHRAFIPPGKCSGVCG